MDDATSNRKQICDPCSLDNQQVEADGYCEDCRHLLCKECFTYHKKPIPSRHHKLTRNLASAKPRDDRIGIADGLYVTDRCEKHNPEVIRFHCVSHDVLGCGTCMMLVHKDCKTVHLPDIIKAPEFKDQQKHVEAGLDQLEKEFTKESSLASSSILEVNRLFVELTNDFLAFKKLIMDELERIDKDIDNLAIQIRDTDQQNLEAVQGKCEQNLQTIRSLKAKGKTVVDENNGYKCYTYMKQTRKDIHVLQTVLDKIKAEKGIQKYEFQPTINMDVEGTLGNVVVFNDESDNESDVTTGSRTSDEDLHAYVPLPKSRSLPDIAPSSHGGIGKQQVQNQNPKVFQATYITDLVTKAPADFEKIEISGIALLPGDRLVIVDKSNQNVKLVNTKKNKVVSEIKVRYKIYNMWEPYGIASVDGNQVAVTCPDRQRIQMLKVKKSLSESSAMKVSGRCYGIAYHDFQQAFIVTFVDPVKVELIDKTGSTVRVLVPTIRARQIFHAPNHIILTNDGETMYISDSEESKVIRIYLGDDVRFVSEYAPDSRFEPLGMAVDKSGRVYVCDMSDDSVHCLNEDCKLLDVVAKGENRFPTCITYNETEETFYMGTSLERVVLFRIDPVKVV